MSRPPEGPDAGDTDVGGRRRALTSAPVRLWLLVVLITVLAAVVIAEWMPATPLQSQGIRVPWWLLAGGFAASEMFPVHLDIRRNTWSATLTEIPLIIGLALSPSINVIIGQVLGCVIGWGLIRRQALQKLSFNTSIAALEAAAAVVVYHLIAGNQSVLFPRVWAAAFAAMLVEGAVSTFGVAAAITALTGTPPVGVLENFLVSGVVASFCGTALGLGAAMVLRTQPYAIGILGIIATVLAFGYHELATTRRRYSGLQLLYGFTEAMQQSTAHSSVIEELLGTTRTLLGAEVAEVVLRHERGHMSRHLLNPDGFDQSDLATSASWVAADGAHGGLLARSGTRDKRASRWLETQGWTDGMVVPLRRNGQMIGAMAVANREGDVATFDTENLKLFETVANHAAMALENHELIDQLQWEALHDTLTGLGNRREFYRSLAAALDERKTGTKIAVALVDLDRFKEINDTFGHHAGDTFLQWLGQRFKDLLPPEAMAARLGGDEFAVFLPYEGDADLAVGVIETVLRPLWEEAFEIQDVEVAVSASTGVAVAPDHAEDPVTLLQRADVAMYLAKKDRTGVAGYTTERDTYSPRRVGLASALRTAIDQGELNVFFQPKLDLATFRISEAEALVRWQHPREGLLLPDQFIPLAERTGLIVPLAEVVLDQALAACAGWGTQLPDTGVAVNLSIGNLTNDTIVWTVHELLGRYRVEPSRLTLEVTESEIMEDERRHVAVLEALAEIGVKISVDDFGTGYASFAYLTRLPVHQVKIDKSFVGLMDVSPNDAAVVRSVIELGRDLGITVVAEGVETEANLQTLRNLGCAVAQGYHIGIPMPSADFEAMAREWNASERAPAEGRVTSISSRTAVRAGRVRAR
jgi:diguanylate cyclase (GGDEF)-like protein